mmetsp:Transcript_97879/g.204113  ORF Transcript_97879/g.204113 Transcript_97879/m.204113 type:complete len:669 (+) Transcript_97879:167-2173(+)|eukprot:CAMPEP_0206471862 /NCGR_PEP_ID=MMETSP0324_2-20121206/31832_1 /ASSEMBLY_ACC=CAM_ASM_000836 /TAXON_ID=2866 /ORGANISM="Crypthecodinium cohnii, Strain Seligo" /LENGTH=668 /DNA_ID=CAMNT_0053946301 /DNA_START=76 /DNA_END=2082 /DNA_ORIENTATION=+
MRLLSQTLTALSIVCFVGDAIAQDAAEPVAEVTEDSPAEGEAPKDGDAPTGEVSTDAEPTKAVPEPPAPAPKVPPAAPKAAPPKPKESAPPKPTETAPPKPKETAPPKKGPVPAKDRTARPMPPKREMATATKPPDFRSDEERQAAIAQAESALRNALAAYEADRMHQQHFRKFVLTYEGLGMKDDLLTKAKKLMLDNAQSMVHAALAHEGDAHMHDHMHRLSTAVDHAIAEGHDGPHVEAAKKLRNTKISEALKAAVKDQDLPRIHQLVEHARIHAGDEMKSEIETHELQLLLSAEALVTGHKKTTVDDRFNLAEAIKICELFELAHEDVPEARKTLRYQEVRHTASEHLPRLIKANDYPGLVQHLKIADEHGVTDAVVLDAKKHAVSIVKELATEAVKAHGTVEDEHPHIMDRGEIERTIRKMKEQQFSEAEIQPVLSALQSRLNLNFKKLQGQEKEITIGSPDLIYWLSEYLAAATNPHLSAMDQASFKPVVQAKVKALLGESALAWRTKPDGFASHASLISYAARSDIDIDSSVVVPELEKFLTALKEELTLALASENLDRVNSARAAIWGMQGAFQFYPKYRDRNYLNLEQDLESLQGKLLKKKSYMAELEQAMTNTNTQQAARTLRANIDRCKKHCGCSDIELAPYQAKLTALEKELATTEL